MVLTKEDHELFQKACDKIIKKERLRPGIGTLAEKTVHAVIKNYIVPLEQYHEIKCGSFVADILMEGEIIEIQTANFNTLRRKLDTFLQEHEVTIVYPIPKIKWILWIDPETGEITKKRKSPKIGTPQSIFRELYKIKNQLNNPRLHLRIIMINVEELRLLNGWSRDKKKGSVRFDRIPKSLEEDIGIDTIKDYAKLLPPNLLHQFTSKEFAKETKLTVSNAQTALNVLTHLEVVVRVGKNKNSIIYEVKNESNIMECKRN